MSVSLVANFFNTVLNDCVRNIPNEVRWLIISLSVVGMLWFFALSINKSKNHEKRPFKVLYLILSILCMGILILYSTFRA